jgi:hypothetical protein
LRGKLAGEIFYNQVVLYPVQDVWTYMMGKNCVLSLQNLEVYKESEGERKE